jgi:CRP-like cAMP-binding protein
MISPEILRKYPLFAGVPPDCLKEVGILSEEKKFKTDDCVFNESGMLKAGAHIYEEGEEAEHLLLLTDGQVDVIYTTYSGDMIVVGSLVPGDVMGISALIPPYRLTASGIARSDGDLIKIEAEGLRKLCEEVPVLGYRLMSAIAKAAMDRLNETRVQLAGQS